MTYYEILQVSDNATVEVIHMAYKALAKKYHPDVCKDENAEEMLKMINEAYDVLSDDEKRKRYDRDLSELKRQAEEHTHKESQDTGKEKTTASAAEASDKKKDSAEKGTGCSGCFSTIFGWIFWIAVIAWAWHSYGDNVKEFFSNITNKAEKVVDEAENLMEDMGVDVEKIAEELETEANYSDMTDKEQIEYVAAQYMKEIIQEKYSNAEKYEVTDNKRLSELPKSSREYCEGFIEELPESKNWEILLKMIQETRTEVKDIEFISETKAEVQIHSVGFDYSLMFMMILYALEDGRSEMNSEERQLLDSLMAENYENDIWLTMEKIDGKWLISDIFNAYDYFNMITGNMVREILDTDYDWENVGKKQRVREYIRNYQGIWFMDITGQEPVDQLMIEIVVENTDGNDIFNIKAAQIKPTFLKNGQVVYQCYGENSDVYPEAVYDANRRLVTLEYYSDGFYGTLELEVKKGELFCNLEAIPYESWLYQTLQINNVKLNLFEQ